MRHSSRLPIHYSTEPRDQIFAVLKPDVFSYHWISTGTPILSLNFWEQVLPEDLGPVSAS